MDAVHFLRPWWLLLIPSAVLLIWLWQRRSDPRTQWRGLIAPHLLDALIVGDKRRMRLRPVHLVGAALILAGLAAAGPTWEREPPPFTQDKAPMIVAIDLSRSMDAGDIAPTRLERTKQKVRDLLQSRRGARTGLVVYAGTAHLVLPPAEDPAVMDIFLQALNPSLMPSAGKNAAEALAIGDTLLAKEPVAGTMLFFTDGFDDKQVAAFKQYAQQSREQILVLGVGTPQGGPLRRKNGSVATDAGGRPLLGRFDGAALRRLSDQAGIPVASLTFDDADVRWVQRRAQTHLEAVEEKSMAVRWKDFGYWLTFPIAVLAALWFRRGWVVRWVPLVLLPLLLSHPLPSHAGEIRLIDLFLTADQQGRWYFEHGDYKTAAERFEDPLWKGLAFYRSGDYQEALGQFANREDAAAFFLMGNCYARLKQYPAAVQAYDNALKARPVFPEAAANRKLVAALIPKKPKENSAEAADPEEKPDQIKFDNQGKKGKMVTVDAAALRKTSAELWMRNLQISPEDFLRQKFEIEAADARRDSKVSR